MINKALTLNDRYIHIVGYIAHSRIYRFAAMEEYTIGLVYKPRYVIGGGLEQHAETCLLPTAAEESLR